MIINHVGLGLFSSPMNLFVLASSLLQQGEQRTNFMLAKLRAHCWYILCWPNSVPTVGTFSLVGTGHFVTQLSASQRRAAEQFFNKNIRKKHYMGSSFSEIFGRNKKCLTRYYITQQGILYLANIIRKTILACQQGPIITFSIQARKKMLKIS